MEGAIAKVLIVDDDTNICEIIKMYLDNSGYETELAYDGREAIEKFKSFNPNLVILDIMLPYVDGIDVLKWIRKENDTPVIMLTAKGETFDKVLGLELGADDYMVKPFEPKELVARAKAVLRRYSAENVRHEVLIFDGLKIDADSFTVMYEGEEIKTGTRPNPSCTQFYRKDIGIKPCAIHGPCSCT